MRLPSFRGFANGGGRIQDQNSGGSPRLDSAAVESEPRSQAQAQASNWKGCDSCEAAIRRWLRFAAALACLLPCSVLLRSKFVLSDARNLVAAARGAQGAEAR